MLRMARREFIDEKERPPSSTVVETADRLLRRLEDGDCVVAHRAADEFGVGIKTIRAALDWLRDSRIVLTFMDGDRCWLGRRGYTPEWEQMTIGQANRMGLLAPWELRRLRAARTFQLPRLSNPEGSDGSHLHKPADWRSLTLGEAVEFRMLTAEEANRICWGARYEMARIKGSLLAF